MIPRRHDAPVRIICTVDTARRGTLANNLRLVSHLGQARPDLVVCWAGLVRRRLDIRDGGQRNGGNEEDPCEARRQRHGNI